MESRVSLMDEPNYFKDDADHRHEDYEESFDLCM